jgi:DNA polymerase-1
MLRHIDWGGSNPEILILLPEKDLKRTEIATYYLSTLNKDYQLGPAKVLAVSLAHNEQGKAPVKLIRQHLEQIKKIVDHKKIKRILCCDGAYFKVLAKVTKVEPHYGYPMPTIWDNVAVFASINYKQMYFNPALKSKLEMSLKALGFHATTQHGLFTQNVIRQASYPQHGSEILTALTELGQVPILSCDIETTGLQVGIDKIRSIAFGINDHTGVAFAVTPQAQGLLRKFFEDYQGRLIFHNATFDTKMLIRNIFMRDELDYQNMLVGLHKLHARLDDTRIMAYLCTNSTAGNNLSLKELAFEHTGNYALEDVQDEQDINKLLEYNMMDVCATWYVYNKFIKEIQKEHSRIYHGLFQPALKVLTQMELVGMPIDIGRIEDTEKELNAIRQSHLDAILMDPLVIQFTKRLKQDAAVQANKKLKKLRKTAKDFADLQFNPGSPKQMRMLLFEYLELPTQNKTKTGLYSTDASTIEALLLITKNPAIRNLLTHIHELSEVEKITSTFIPAFKNKSVWKGADKYLMGNFNLGGTKSGRLSSSDPNLTNIPSTGTKYAKAVKKCFRAPVGKLSENWVMVSCDFASLEDRISALQTKDENKLAVYTQGYDGHCLRAFAYFGKHMPDITQEVAKTDLPGKFFKVTHDDGTEEYLHENHPRLAELQSR